MLRTKFNSNPNPNRRWTSTVERRRGCLRHLDGLLWPCPLTYDLQNLIRSSVRGNIPCKFHRGLCDAILTSIHAAVCKVLTTTQPPYGTFISSSPCTQRPRSTRSSSFITLARPPSSSSLKITDRSFRYASPFLWNQLPLSLRKPHSGTSSSISYSPIPSPITSSSSDSPLCTSITPSLFHSQIKNLHLLQILPP